MGEPATTTAAASVAATPLLQLFRAEAVSHLRAPTPAGRLHRRLLQSLPLVRRMASDVARAGAP